MEDRSAGVSGKEVWSELLQATQDALTNLSADELEALVRRAEALSARVNTAFCDDTGLRESLVELKMAAPHHRLLGDLLSATNDNLQVLRKLYRQQTSEGIKSPWAH